MKSIDNARELPWIKSLKGPNDDDHADRLNHRYTACILLICAIFCSGAPIAFNRITCWVPAHFVGAFQKYTEHYCWISNTYYIPINETIPNSKTTRGKAEIGYYQWVPFILLTSAFFFYLPRLLWRSMNTRSGINLQGLVKKTNANAISSSIELYCDPYEKSSSLLSRSLRSLCCTSGKHLGNYLSVIFIMTKFLYLINSILQLFFIQFVLGQPGWLYGFSIWRSIFIHNSVLTDSPYFPRVTLCDLRIREVGNLHRYTVQCVLPINMLNEKVFSLLWFWFFGVAIWNIFSFTIALFNFMNFYRRRNFIHRQYQLSKKTSGKLTQTEFNSFVDKFLKQDGFLIIRMIQNNSDNVLAPAVVDTLYKTYRESDRQRLENVSQQHPTTTT